MKLINKDQVSHIVVFKKVFVGSIGKVKKGNKKPFIQIFSAGKEIHTEYFDTYEQLEQHIKDNYDNCKIKYE